MKQSPAPVVSTTSDARTGQDGAHTYLARDSVACLMYKLEGANEVRWASSAAATEITTASAYINEQTRFTGHQNPARS